MTTRGLAPALTDLTEIYDDISLNNPAAARRVVEEIRAAVRRLAHMPHLGHVGRWARTRELVLPPSYVVAYRVTDEVVEIIAARHVARKWPQDPPA